MHTYTRSAGLVASAVAGLTMLAPLASGAPTHESAKTRVVTLTMQTSSPALRACYPQAKAKIAVKLTTEKLGFDVVTVAASGLKPNTSFTLFLLSKAGPPFGAAEYFGDFRTNPWGSAKAEFRLIAQEAFAFNGETLEPRIDLNSMGFWFADEAADDACLSAKSPVTPFDGDGKAGVQMMNSGTQVLP